MIEETHKHGTFKDSFTHGILMGLALIAVSLILHLLDLSREPWAIVPSVVVMWTLITLGLLQIRNRKLDGFISYGKALGTGTLLSLVAAMLLAIYTYIFLEFIDPGFIDSIMEKAYNDMQAQGSSEAEIDMAMKITEGFTNPFVMAFTGIFTNVLLGFLGSLIIAAAVKREPGQNDLI